MSGRPLVMGILNVTPDSFSDGGRYAGTQAAVARGLEMARESADILDVGGESTRPGADAVPEAEERARVVPVVEALARETDTVISVDTCKAGVAERALAAGARVINDVTALSGDPRMADVARESGAGVVLMHMRGTPRTMQDDPRYEDVVGEVAAYLAARVEDAVAAGIRREALAVDPGIGFGKTVEHNLALLAGLDRIGACGRPVVVGLSRKSFLGKLTGREVQDRLAGSLAALAFCVAGGGAQVMRVHDVKASCDAVRVAAALGRARNGVG
jgi:dihydropteroate synthase